MLYLCSHQPYSDGREHTSTSYMYFSPFYSVTLSCNCQVLFNILHAMNTATTVGAHGRVSGVFVLKPSQQNSHNSQLRMRSAQTEQTCCTGSRSCVRSFRSHAFVPIRSGKKTSSRDRQPRTCVLFHSPNPPLPRRKKTVIKNPHGDIHRDTHERTLIKSITHLG